MQPRGPPPTCLSISENIEGALGGFGSGRPSLRPAFEASLRIDLAAPHVKAIVSADAFRQGSLNWTSAGAPAGSVGYAFYPGTADHAEFVLRYALNGVEQSQRIQLVTTVPRFGGRRWWFLCPLFQRKGERKLVRCVCLPPGGRYFASRAAHRLNYQSQKDSRDLLGFLDRLQVKYGFDPA